MQNFTVAIVNGYLHWLKQILGYVANLCISYYYIDILIDKHNNTIVLYCFYSERLHVSAVYISRY
jgi:hypothetical protein